MSAGVARGADGPADPRATAVVRAAGAVVTRPGHEVLLVHRPRYDDWSFPKGKVDPGEHVTATAVREVAEETGLVVRLGVPLTRQRYEVAARAGSRGKTVDYWSARVVGPDDVAGYRRGDEIDEVVWLPFAEAADRLTYPHDRRTLAEAVELPRRTGALVVLRHGDARPRSSWDALDPLRPLADRGHEQARGWVPILGAYGVDEVVSSPSTRCVQTVAPFLDAAGLEPDLHPCLSEEGADARSVRRLVTALLEGRRRAVLCTHRPVLPLVYDALAAHARPGVATRPSGQLAKGAAIVAHHHRGAVVTTETVTPATTSE
ncbi:NUDIX hydrolase [Nocardioides sp. CPCC 205120]|uniref:NUDIX hydrolase n=1 Tax=Nocardioides sp. CPCC 205120 TaxID=3406462 RepID=UPI003B5053EA